MNDVLDTILLQDLPRRRSGVGLFLALALHLVVAFAATRVGAAKSQVVLPDMSVVAIAPETEVPPAESAEAQPLVAPPETPAARPSEPKSSGPRAPAPAPVAAAGAVLSANDDAPVDLTGGMVVGMAETYGGGVTSSIGTGARPGGYGAPGAEGTGRFGSAGGSTTPPAPPGPDRSSAPRLADGMSWACPFPAEADEKGIDDTVVRLAIEVDAGGRPVTVSIEKDPGSGFGREAAACARRKTFQPARDRVGNPTPAKTRIDVRFHR
jgi:TonB family protein